MPRKTRSKIKLRKLIKPKNYTFKLQCSPSKHDKTDFSCYSENDIHKIKMAWNKRHPDSLIISNDPYEVWSILKEYTKHSCKNEKCWLSNLFKKNEIDEDLLLYTFSPERPQKWHKNPREWLSSTDIENVMAHYEKLHDNFSFIGSSPIDFDTIKYDGECVWPELCHFNIANYNKQNINKIGISLNLDKHTQPGSHWVSIFIDLRKKFIFYFDSNGDKTPIQVKRLLNRIQEQCNDEFDCNMELLENSKEHQRKNTECGIYSIYFITSLLENKDPEYFINERITDDEMFSLRDKFFN